MQGPGETISDSGVDLSREVCAISLLNFFICCRFPLHRLIVSVPFRRSFPGGLTSPAVDLVPYLSGSLAFPSSLVTALISLSESNGHALTPIFDDLSHRSARDITPISLPCSESFPLLYPNLHAELRQRFQITLTPFMFPGDMKAEFQLALGLGAVVVDVERVVGQPSNWSQLDDKGGGVVGDSPPKRTKLSPGAIEVGLLWRGVRDMCQRYEYVAMVLLEKEIMSYVVRGISRMLRMSSRLYAHVVWSSLFVTDLPPRNSRSVWPLS